MIASRFTSALYLGLEHPSSRLPAWPRLTLGVPAVLGESRAARDVAERFAALVDAEAAVTAPSTLHVVFDLFPLLATSGTTIYVDRGTYPISRWGIERAVLHGARLRRFPMHRAEALRALLRADAPSAHRPIIACDAVCPTNGRVAPLGDYFEVAAEHGGVLAVDESQAIGVLGRDPSRENPYGRGGGGAAVQMGVSGRNVIRFASLSKGLGAPVAVLAGSRALVDMFCARAETRVHCSPPSIANLLAASRALAINARHGDALRRRLADRVTRFRRQLAPSGLLRSATLFPVQPLRVPPGEDPEALAARLAAHGVAAALTHGDGRETFLTFVLTATHEASDVDRAAQAVWSMMHRSTRRAG